MGNLEWRTPSVADFNLLSEACFTNGVMSCVDSSVNIILFREKYKTKICQVDGIILRKYHARRDTQNDIPVNSAMYGFPLGSGDYKKAIELLLEDAKNDNSPAVFPFLAEINKIYLQENFPNRFEFTERRDDADYLYLSENLGNLPGRKFHKKKNHIAQFMKKYPNAEYRQMTKENLSDARIVENAWNEANDGNKNESTRHEHNIIDEALKEFETLNLCGGILYVENKPVAMTIASAMSASVLDVYFEKVIPGFDRDGGYAVINNLFSKSMMQYKYLNREEDLGIEGLRKAKLSYQPDIILTKWSAHENI